MSGIFLSYRRGDAAGWAGRLYEHLVGEWGDDHVFMDIDAISPGEDFREAIARTMAACDVVLVLIGPSWLTARDAQGNRRLDDEADTHRSEIVAALRSDVRVVPVLVGGASMPKASDLPEPLRDLVHRNAAIIEDRRFASDVASLQEALRGLVARDAADGGAADPPGVAATPGRVPPRGRAGPARRGGGPAGPGVPARAGLPALPVGLALAGALLVLVWGVVVQRGWHNEFEAVRVVAGILLVLGTTAGLARRRWRWVAAAGLTGLVGTVLWLLWLLSTHPDDVGEILAPGYDGFANAMALLGALLVLSAGLLAVRAGPRAAVRAGPRAGES